MGAKQTQNLITHTAETKNRVQAGCWGTGQGNNLSKMVDWVTGQGKHGRERIPLG